MSEDKLEGLSREVKQQIKRWVLKLRHLFQADFGRQLRRYGIDAETGVTPLSKLDYLTEDEQMRREVIGATIKRDAQNEGSLEAGVTAYVREAAYTYLNRLVGLKCMEARAILFVDGEDTEVVTTRPEYGGRSRLLWQMRDADQSYHTADDGEERLWHDGLMRAFEAVTEDIKLLFDPQHEYSQLFPTHKTLMEAIGLINETFPMEVYAYPDFLGWVYQFFNVEEKERIRKETGGKPRTSYELAVINQFYTPDWIVKFLVDNTLGRVWLQMHPDTQLYWLNRIPEEHRGQPREEIPEGVRDAEIFQGVNIDYLVPDTGEDEPIPLKPVGEMKLLDPACGTMHFGQYAFALLYEMYLEEIEHAGAEGWPEQALVSSREEIPNAILERNLYGVDIDARAIQIAALTLMLTMKEQAAAHGLDPQALKVWHMNLVCADAVNLGEVEMEKFLQRLDPTIFGGDEPMQRAVEAIWESLQHVAELGSLIQPGEEVERALSQPVKYQLRFYSPDQIALGSGPEWGENQRELTAEERVMARDYLLDKLQEFAAENGDTDVMQRLFAQETEKGLRLLTVLGQKYEAVVMNPPYGQPINKMLLRELLPSSYYNIYAAFMEFGVRQCAPHGFAGALTERMFLVQYMLRNFRQSLLQDSHTLLGLIDLWYGVLDDAMNRTCATVLSRAAFDEQKEYFALNLSGDRKKERFRAAVSAEEIERVGNRLLAVFPNRAYLYGLPPAAYRLYASGLNIGSTYGSAQRGLDTASDMRSVFLRWEIPLTNQEQKPYFPFVKGGDHSRYYRDVEFIIDFSASARERYERIGSVRNRDYHLQPSVAWPDVSASLNAQVNPSGTILSISSDACFPHGKEFEVLALANSSVCEFFAKQTYDGHHWVAGVISAVPVPSDTDRMAEQLPELARQAHSIKMSWDTGSETCTRFQMPWLLRVMRADVEHPACPDWRSLHDLVICCLDWEEERSADCQRLQDGIDEIVYDVYEISPEEREVIESELVGRPKETVWPQMGGKSREEKRLEHVQRLLSYFVKVTVEEDQDGIVPLVPCGDEPTLLQRVRQKLDETFGTDRGYAIETEINNELGSRKTIETWLTKDYFRYHVKLYKRRPIYWHIASSDGSFGALVHYHRFDYDGLQKLRAHYLASFITRLRAENGKLSGNDSREARKQRQDLEKSLAAAQELDEKLGQIQEGDPHAIEVPWKEANEQPKGWRPDIDDGVKVNIGPFQEASVLSVKKVV